MKSTQERVADDPDDFLRELQVLAFEAGGDPTAAMIMVSEEMKRASMPLFVKIEWPPTKVVTIGKCSHYGHFG